MALSCFQLLAIALGLVTWEVSCWTVPYHHLKRQKTQRLAASSSSNDDDDESAALARALARSHPAKTAWYADGLPFDCTECGKCCKTQGSVYMNPNEIQQASDILNVTTKAFIETYASRTLQSDEESLPWIRLINNNQGACVFLDPDTNQCGIYQARPTQCSTYPFWPNIMRSRESWNDEVRIPDEEEENKEIPYWTSHGGGCEGMKLIGDETNRSGVVTSFDAYEQLVEYQHSERLFPKDAIIRRVKRKHLDT